MYCKNCGAQVDPNAAICVNCGTALGKGTNFCHNCGEALNPGAAVCMKCGYAVQKTEKEGEKKSKIATLLLCLFLGGWGVHSFYLGYTSHGIWQIVLTCCTGIGGSIWAFVDLIRLLTGSLNKDAKGNPLKEDF